MENLQELVREILQGFRSAKDEVFNTSSVNVHGFSHVVVLPSTDGKTHVSIDPGSEDVKGFSTYMDKGVLQIKQVEPDDSNVIINDRQVYLDGPIIGSNVIINSKVDGRSFGGAFGNGASRGAFSQATQRVTPRIRLHMPVGSNLTAAQLGQDTQFVSTVPHTAAKLTIYGDDAKAAVIARDLHIDAGDDTEVYATVTGGSLTVNKIGDGKVATEGVYANVEATLQGDGKIKTAGEVAGAYAGTVLNGDGKIIHKGPIRGRMTTRGNVKIKPTNG